MLGAIMGDICGAPWEGGACRTESFELFAHGSTITDDTVCTIAVAEALLTGKPVAAALRDWCRRYLSLGYGSQFNLWVYRTSMGPYNSWGNGGVMRVSACGWLANSLEEAEQLAESTAAVTHNHPEGVRGARAVAGTLWLAKQRAAGVHLPLNLSGVANRYGYPLGLSVLERAAMNPAGCEAVDTVHIALDCALQATSVADAIHRAAYIGGDVDTTASMAAAIAEARFGLTDLEVATILDEVPTEMHSVIRAVYAQAGVRVGGLLGPEPISATTSPVRLTWVQRLLAYF